MSDETEQDAKDDGAAEDGPLRIAVLGAGPIGLEVALYGRYLGYQVSLFDPGDVCEGWVGSSNPMSTFRENCTPLGVAAIDAQNAEFEIPAADDCLSIDEWCTKYCVPLAKTDLVRRTLRMQTQVESITFDAEAETYELVSNAEGNDAADVYDYVIDTRSLSVELESQPQKFTAAETEDFVVMLRNGTEFDFRSAAESIVRIYAMIGERDGLNVYESMQQYAL